MSRKIVPDLGYHYPCDRLPFSGLFVPPMTFDDECLSNIWEFEVVVKFGGDPDFTSFNPAVISSVTSYKIGFQAVLKV